MADYQVYQFSARDSVSYSTLLQYTNPEPPLVVDTLQTPECRPLRLTLAIQCRIATSLHNRAACKLCKVVLRRLSRSHHQLWRVPATDNLYQ